MRHGVGAVADGDGFAVGDTERLQRARAGDGADRAGCDGRVGGDRGVAGDGERIVRRRLRGLLGLLGERFGRFDELGDRGDAVIRRLDRLLRLADRVEQPVQVAGAIVERLRGEEIEGAVERRVDFLPVARRFCVMLIKLAVLCKDRRFCRTPAESTTSLILDVLLHN
jgi:hypothetical protein